MLGGSTPSLCSGPRGILERAPSIFVTIHILVVDDYEDWRNEIRLLLQSRPELQVICEVADGPEAVQKAEELRPDLVLLDIALPTLNGIEAARRIRKLSPNTKIVFLSLDTSLDVRQVALSTGAEGYVYKSRAQSDLLPAIDATLQGKRFVSSMLRPYPLGQKAPRRHEVLFYSDDEVLLNSLTDFVAAALKGGNAAIVLATKSHRDGLFQRLKAERVDAEGAIRQGTYISMDAADTLSTILVDGMPDPARFFAGLGRLIEAAARATKTERPQVAVFGEAVALLQAEGKADAAIRFEQLGNELARTHEVRILCAYPLSSFRGEENQHVFQSICAEHSAALSQL